MTVALQGQACKGNACTDVCSPNPCAGGYKCIASGHSYTCAQCTADSDCASNKKCSNNTCIDACSGNNCASQSKKCMTNGSHGYTCYGCTSDAACPNDQRCDTRTSACVSICPSACSGQHCTVSGAHKATCSGCTSDEGCPSGQKCDVEANACVATCTPQKCADENGGTAEDWYIKETSTGCECATDKKYVILADVHPDIRYSPEKYSRIKAVKDFGNIKKGTLGGYIEKESNLSQTGNAWVGCDSTGCALAGDDSQVYGNALVSGGGATDYNGKPDGYGGATRLRGTAKVYENAKVLNGSDVSYCKVHGNAVVHGATVYSGTTMKPENPGYKAAQINGYNSNDKCDVYGDAQIYVGSSVSGKVYGKAIISGGKGAYSSYETAYVGGEVYGNAKINGGVSVSGNAKIYDSALLTEGIKVEENAKIYGNAQVGGYAYIKGTAQVYGNAVFKPASPNAVTYLRGNATLSGTATVKSPGMTGNHIICKGNYTKGTVAWQASYSTESKVCPQ